MSNKEQRVTIRLTPEQYESIRAKAATAFLTPSAFIRAAAMRHKVTVVPGLKELARELNAVGRNLNQLVVLSHEGRIQAVRLDETIKMLYKIYDRMTELSEMESH